MDVCRVLRDAPEELRRLVGWAALRVYLGYLVSHGLLEEAARVLRELGPRVGVPAEAARREAERLEALAKLIAAGHEVDAAAAYLRETGRLPREYVERLERLIPLLEELTRRGGDVGEQARRLLEAVRDLLALNRLAELQERARRAASEATRLFEEAFNQLQEAYRLAAAGDLAGLATRLSLVRSLVSRLSEAERLLAEAVREAELIARHACGTGRCREAAERAKRLLDEMRMMVHAERVTIEKLADVVLGELYPALANARALLHELPDLPTPVAAGRLATVVRGLYAAADHLAVLARELPGLYPERVRGEIRELLESLASSVSRVVEDVVKALGEAAAANDALWQAYVDALSASGRPTPTRPEARSLEEQVERVLRQLRDFANIFYHIGISMTNFRDGMRALMAASTGYYLEHLARLFVYLVPSLVAFATMAAERLRRAAQEAMRFRLQRALDELFKIGAEAVAGMLAPIFEARNWVERLAAAAALLTAMAIPIEELAARGAVRVARRIPIPERVYRALEEAGLRKWAEDLASKPVLGERGVKLYVWLETNVVKPFQALIDTIRTEIRARLGRVESLLREIEEKPGAYIVKLEKLEPEVVITAEGVGPVLREALRSIEERLKRELPPELAAALYAKLAKQLAEMTREARPVRLGWLLERVFRLQDEMLARAFTPKLSESLMRMLAKLEQAREAALEIYRILSEKRVEPVEALETLEEILAKYKQLRSALEEFEKLYTSLAPSLPHDLKERITRVFWRYVHEGRVKKVFEALEALREYKEELGKLKALATRILEPNPSALAELAEAKTPAEVFAVVLRYIADTDVAKRFAMMAGDLAGVLERLRRAAVELAALFGPRVETLLYIEPGKARVKRPIPWEDLAKYMKPEHLNLLKSIAKRLGLEMLTLEDLPRVLREIHRLIEETENPALLFKYTGILEGLTRYLLTLAESLGKLRETRPEFPVPLADVYGRVFELYREARAELENVKLLVRHLSMLYDEVRGFLEEAAKVLRRYGLEHEANLLEQLARYTELSIRDFVEGRVEALLPPDKILAKAAEVLRKAAERLSRRDIEKLIAELERLEREEKLAPVAAQIISELLEAYTEKYGLVRIETGTILDKIFAAKTPEAVDLIHRLLGHKRVLPRVVVEDVMREVAVELEKMGAPEELVKQVYEMPVLGTIQPVREVKMLPGETRIVWHVSLTTPRGPIWAKYVLGFKLVEVDGRPVVRWYKVIEFDPEARRRPLLRAVLLEALKRAVESDELATRGGEVVILAERPVTFRELVLTEVLPGIRMELEEALREVLELAMELPPGFRWVLTLPPVERLPGGIMRLVEVKPGLVVIRYKRGEEEARITITPGRVSIEGSLPLLVEALRFDVRVRREMRKRIPPPPKRPETLVRVVPGGRVKLPGGEMVGYVFHYAERIENVERMRTGGVVVTLRLPGGGKLRLETPEVVVSVEYTGRFEVKPPTLPLPALPGGAAVAVAGAGVAGRPQKEKLIL